MLTDSYPPMLGGVARHVRGLAQYLIRLGDQVNVVSLSPPNEIFPNAGIQLTQARSIISFIPHLCRISYAPPFPDVYLMRIIEKEMKSFKPDVIHAHGKVALTASNLKTKYSDTSFITTLHNYFFCCPKCSLFKENRLEICSVEKAGFYCLKCLRSNHSYLKALGVLASTLLFTRKLSVYDSFIAVSNSVASVAKRHFYEKIVVIPNFIEIDEYDSSEEETLGVCERNVMFLGALTPLKGIHVLLEAFKKLSGLKGIKLTIVGFPYPDYLIPSISNSKMEIIINAPREMVLKKLKNCSVLVVPSLFLDPCPTVALEGMLFKKPIIASSIGGLQDIVIDGETGLLVQPNDPAQLTNAIRTILDDPSLAAKMGEKGFRRLTKHFTSEVVIPQIRRTYEKDK